MPLTTANFVKWDFRGALFPMRTNLLLAQAHEDAVKARVATIVNSSEKVSADAFLPQTRVHAAKANGHLRRTVLLDPVATYFLYDLVLRNNKSFGKLQSSSRRSFGYSFKGGKPVPIHSAYAAFVQAVRNESLIYGNHIAFDIAAYFNSIYHHDAQSWFCKLPGVTPKDGAAFGKFARQINSGRSIDFMPQGIYPAKMLGAEFLNFLESTGEVQCAQTFRFMDDIHIFDANESIVRRDFLRIQELLGNRSLDVNPSPATTGSSLSVIDLYVERHRNIASTN